MAGAGDLENPLDDRWRFARDAVRAPPLGVLLRLHLIYLLRHRRPLSLAHPARFTELVQRRKLFDRDRRFARLIDKIAVKAFVADRLGAAWVTPTLWSGSALPQLPHWPRPFVVKSRHGCNQRRFCRGDEDWGAVRRAASAWMRSDHCRWLDEWGYRDLPRGLLVEPFVGVGGVLPVDYKLYVFHGRVEAVQVHLDREHRHRWLVFDRGWHRLSSPTADPDPPPPACLDRMIAGAETLGRDFDFVRVDLYEVRGAPRFGEMTFYPGSGFDRFDPPEIDVAFGRYWTGAAPGRR